jgi:hypothetical protein
MSNEKERESDALIRKLRAVLDESRSYIGAPTFSPSMDSEAAEAVELADQYLAGRASLDSSPEPCKHESDGLTYTSMPPQLRCKKCRAFYGRGASLPLPAAGQEPVAHLWQHGETGRTRVVMPDMMVDADASWQAVGPLYLGAAPQPAVAAGWVSVEDRLPEPGKPVLLDIGKKHPIRAMWVAKYTLPVGLEDDSGFGEYDEEKDEWFCPEGWYEWNQHEETHWFVDEATRAWCELPQALPPAPSTEGESNG